MHTVRLFKERYITTHSTAPVDEAIDTMVDDLLALVSHFLFLRFFDFRDFAHAINAHLPTHPASNTYNNRHAKEFMNKSSRSYLIEAGATQIKRWKFTT